MTTATRRAQIASYVEAFAFQKLFIEELGWDRYHQDLAVEVNGTAYLLHGVAQKRGVVALVCDPDARGGVPDYATRQKIEAQVTRSLREHLIIFVDKDHTQQHWLWVRRKPGQPTAYRGEQYYRGQSGERLIQKLQQIAIEMADEEALSHLDVALRMEKGFDVERVTKRFYDRFQTEHKNFVQAISGIADGELRAWYASLMLNRLMFAYFIQQKSFLDGDINYLPNKLRQVQDRFGPDQFHAFYREFLLHFFHDGLGRPESDRSPAIRALIGRIPYVNGGLFEQHTIEQSNPNIAIPDAAFERIFAFFGAYSWHLDDRPLRADNEINPDVLGYIFEKYINQKQMGAYYTKEDITGYIGRNTILPFLFDQAREKCGVAFQPDGEVWRLLRDDPDRYIYDAVRKGVDEPLPPEIAVGLDDVSKRGGWNRPAPEPFALPTETWREHVARRTRCLELRRKLAAGEVTQVNDLITYNLDIERFTRDVIERCEGPELLRAFWQAATSVTILDPTCGSGAFLFAALNILEPLYEACLDRMRAFVDDSDRLGERPKGPDFREVLARVAQHPNRRYFILKTIIIKNLYGVDIMAEACEIAKLRLFLKLVAQVEAPARLEPLPDIDFNIRAGNTLVGFATYAEAERAVSGNLIWHEQMPTIAQKAGELNNLFKRFREQQTTFGGSVTQKDKLDLRQRLSEVGNTLDHFLAAEYGIDEHHYPDNAEIESKFAGWHASHQPFHWFVEFYGIVHERSGFDVIIGNPPYVDLKAMTEYSIRDLQTVATRNLYAPMMERSLAISKIRGRLGFIVPVSSISTEGYRSLQDVVLSHPLHVSSYDDRPSRLFDGLEHIRLSIHLIQNAAATRDSQYSTQCYRWNTEERATLFSRLRYQPVTVGYLPCSLPKISDDLELSVLKKVWKDRQTIDEQQRRLGTYPVYFSRKLSSFLQVLDFVPKVYDGMGKLRPPSEFKDLRFDTHHQAEVAFCLFNSTLFRWFMNVFSDFRHVNKREVEGFRLDMSKAIASSGGDWQRLSAELSRSLQDTSEYRQMKFSHDVLRVQCILPKFSKLIIDEIDRVLARHFGFTDEELDFIINYDFKYRMGLDNGSGDEGESDGGEE